MSIAITDVAAVMRSHPEGVTTRQIARELGIGRPSVSNRLGRLMQHGYAERIPVVSGWPKYRLKDREAADA